MIFTDEMFAKQMQPITGSAIRAIFHLLNKPGMISLAGGNPALSALEPEIIAELAREVLLTTGAPLLQYGSTEGFAPLRESYADLLSNLGMSIKPSQVLPTQGSQQALDLLLKALIDPGDVILVEEPMFLGALQTMRTYNAKLVALPMDDEGVIVEAAEEAIKRHHPKLIYIIPTFQNPTGKSLSESRRKPLAELAAKYGVILAEDDPYRDLRYTGVPKTPIKAFDQEDWVVYLGSFSKIISPGLRVGAAVVTNDLLMRKMVIGKQSTDVHTPLLNQAIIDAYLRKGLLPDHIRRICANYKRQMEAMLSSLSQFPEGIRYTTPEGGLFLWVELPEHIDAGKMLEKATARNVAYVPGASFYIENGRKNTLRLNFSNSELPEIERGMAALKATIEEEF